MTMICVKNLTKKYGNFTAVDDISFDVKKGEIFGFLGPNGAGKTSTINMMIGLLKPNSGKITINEIDVIKQAKKAQEIMGIVADESNLYNEMDGFANLCFCGALYGMEKKERESKARELLKLFRLQDAGNRPFKAYSKGMKRKLTIAAALIHSPKILFLDEPTTGIDVESSRQIRELILQLKNQGTTIFITTHYIEEAERLCDRIAFIVQGKIVASGTVFQLMNSVSHSHNINLITNKDVQDYTTALQKRFKEITVTVKKPDELVIKTAKRIPLLPILKFLHEKDIEVYEAKEIHPSLEDVFVKLTGIETSVLQKEKGGF
jgi:ABC-2 type transport system ATP-binding protein